MTTRFGEIVNILQRCNAAYYRNKLHGDVLEYDGVEYRTHDDDALPLTELQNLVEFDRLDEFLFVDHFSGYRPSIFVGNGENFSIMYAFYVSAEKPFREGYDWGVQARRWMPESGPYLLLFETVC